MRNEYRVGPVYRAGLIVSGGMCAGLGIAILAVPALHRVADTEVLPASVPTAPAAALGFAACGLALIGIGLWFPRVTSVLAMVTLSMVVVLAGVYKISAGFPANRPHRLPEAYLILLKNKELSTSPNHGVWSALIDLCMT